MGWCHEFGTQVHEGCTHPMQATAPDACSCSASGFVCHGHFSGCAEVWARGPQPLDRLEPPAEASTAVVFRPGVASNGNGAAAGQARAPIERVQMVVGADTGGADTGGVDSGGVDSGATAVAVEDVAGASGMVAEGAVHPAPDGLTAVRAALDSLTDEVARLAQETGRQRRVLAEIDARVSAGNDSPVNLGSDTATTGELVERLSAAMVPAVVAGVNAREADAATTVTTSMGQLCSVLRATVEWFDGLTPSSTMIAGRSPQAPEGPSGP